MLAFIGFLVFVYGLCVSFNAGVLFLGSNKIGSVFTFWDKIILLLSGPILTLNYLFPYCLLHKKCLSLCNCYGKNQKKIVGDK